MTTDRELADAYGLIVDLKARIEALERALKEIRAYAANPNMEIARTGFSIIEKTANAALRETQHE